MRYVVEDEDYQISSRVKYVLMRRKLMDRQEKWDGVSLGNTLFYFTTDVTKSIQSINHSDIYLFIFDAPRSVIFLVVDHGCKLPLSYPH